MKTILFFIVLICKSLSFLFGSAASKCITPPMVCPNENITFWLYTRKNRDYPVKISANDAESISNAPWVKGAAIKVLIHGYTGHKNFSPNTEIRPVYLDCCDYNIISVDYNPIALEPCYLESAHNTELVGMCLAQLIDALVSRGFQLAKFHLIGFSLGGQVAGLVSNYLKSGRLERISALDPALPLFATQDNRKKIDAGDARFVDVLHTNALQRGKLERCGAADFFANTGMLQPGCKTTKEQSASSCAHARAPLYFAESITSDVGFYGAPCSSWLLHVVGWCQLSARDEELYGERMSHNVSGIYFFTTNPQSPFAKGPSKAKNT